MFVILHMHYLTLEVFTRNEQHLPLWKWKVQIFPVRQIWEKDFSLVSFTTF